MITYLISMLKMGDKMIYIRSFISSPIVSSIMDMEGVTSLTTFLAHSIVENDIYLPTAFDFLHFAQIQNKISRSLDMLREKCQQFSEDSTLSKLLALQTRGTIKDHSRILHGLRIKCYQQLRNNQKMYSCMETMTKFIMSLGFSIWYVYILCLYFLTLSSFSAKLK